MSYWIEVLKSISLLGEIPNFKKCQSQLFLDFVVGDLFNNSVFNVPLLIYGITQENTREFFSLFSQSYDLTVVSIPAEKIAHNQLA